MVDLVVNVNEGVNIPESAIAITRSVKEQIQSNPSRVVIAFILFALTIIQSTIDYQLSFLMNVILAVNGLAFMPFTTKRPYTNTKWF